MTKAEWQERFRSRLASIMNDRCLSPYRLASVSGLSRSRLSDYMNGRVVPSPYAIVNIAYALDVSINDLVDFDERIYD